MSYRAALGPPPQPEPSAVSSAVTQRPVNSRPAPGAVSGPGVQQCSPGGAQRRPSWQCTTGIRTVNKSPASPPDAPTPTTSAAHARSPAAKNALGSPAQQRQAHTHGGPATSSAHARLPCDPDVVRATSSDHGSPACDPTVAGDPPPHTNHFHPLHDGHGRTASSQIVTAARRQRATAARIQLSHTAASTTPRQRLNKARKIQLPCTVASTVLKQR
jgi:hypothetical protein